MKTILLLLLSVSLIATACHTHKKADISGSDAKAVSVDQNANAETYRLIVSFASRGAGINSEQRQKFLKYIAGYKKKPTYKTVLWGREGETDYCFKLEGWSQNDVAEFVGGMKDIVAGNDLITLEENAPCRHQAHR